jgi:mycofactocin precursor
MVNNKSIVKPQTNTDKPTNVDEPEIIEEIKIEELSIDGICGVY